MIGTILTQRVFPWRLILTLGAIVLSSGTGLYYGYQYRDGQAAEEALRAAQEAEAARELLRMHVRRVEADLERSRAIAKQRQRVITQEVDRVVEVYRDRACLDDDGLRVIAEALGTGNPGVAAPAVPAASAPQ